MTYSITDLTAELIRDEKEVLHPYPDTRGKVTIGVGRNLTDVGISQAESRLLLLNDIHRSEADLDHHAPWWRNMTPARQRALLNMCFNMGWGNGTRGLSSFHNSLALLAGGQYAEAAAALMKSLWAKQVGARAERITAQILQG